MDNGVDQVRAWKDAEGTGGPDAEHPAGEVQLPVGRGHVVRAMVLAGLVLGVSALGEAGTLHAGTTTGP